MGKGYTFSELGVTLSDFFLLYLVSVLRGIFSMMKYRRGFMISEI
jgi:hypothetical protein